MPDPITAAVSAVKGGSSILKAKNSKKAAKRAAETAAAGQEKALALQKEMFDRQVALQEPFRQAGVSSTAELMRQMGLGGDAASQGYGNMLRDFTMSDYQADPGYAFRMSEGLKGLDRQAAARGGLISGAALKAASDFSGKQASAEYQNAYDRYNKNRQMRYGFLGGQQELGANAVNALGGAARNYATQGGQNITSAADARASQYGPIANYNNQMIGDLTSFGTDLLGGMGKFASPAASKQIAAGYSRWNDPTASMNNSFRYPTGG
jgi:hypothetical protein